MQHMTFLVVLTFLLTAVSLTFGPVNLVASSDEDDDDNTPAHTGDRGFGGKIGTTESAPQSSKSPVEVETSGENDEENRSDPAHRGEIVSENEDGEVIKNIPTESAPQSSEASHTEILSLELKPICPLCT